MATEASDSYAGWAARHGHLRASDADRELVIDALKTAFVQGRLSRSELGRRTGQALESRTYTDLAGATADIPAGRRVTRPVPAVASRPAAARAVNRRLIAWVVGAAIAAPGLGVAFFATYYGSFFILLLLGLVVSSVIGPAERPAVRRRGVH